jgi:glycosyltransferase involved in cell wall biosynthesis
MSYASLQLEEQSSPTAARPLRVMFLITSMPVGGAEVLLANLIRRLDRSRCVPYLGCLKELGPLGEELAAEGVPTFSQLIRGKYDVRVLWQLVRRMRSQKIDAVVTVGAGDKMFWGRLAAKIAGVPVICSALHSTGWPDGVGKLNRLLTPITDGFIGVAARHGRHLIENEHFPALKVHVIPNGVDTERFQPNPNAAAQFRHELHIPSDAPVTIIVAALRPEKNHLLFLEAASLVRSQRPDAHFIIVGEGPERPAIELGVQRFRLGECVHLVGSRSDIPELLSACDAFMLTSHNEANPVSILEAMSVGLPVVSTNVGSVCESVEHGVTGFLAQPGNACDLADSLLTVFSDRELAAQLGAAGRQTVIDRWSLEAMVRGYEDLICGIFAEKHPRCRTA